MRALALVALFGAGGVLFGDVAPALADAALEEAFRGVAVGRGRMESRMAGVDRGFTIRTFGRKTGDTFVLQQAFRFDDGKRDRRTWRFRKIGPGRYVGNRADLVAPAVVRVENDRIRLSYDIDMRRRDGRKVRLHFEDTVLRQGRNMILNRGVISALGLPVGRIDVTFERQ